MEIQFLHYATCYLESQVGASFADPAPCYTLKDLLQARSARLGEHSSGWLKLLWHTALGIGQIFLPPLCRRLETEGNEKEVLLACATAKAREGGPQRLRLGRAEPSGF